MNALKIGLIVIGLALTGCGESTDNLGEGNRGGQFDFPSESKWTQSKFDSVRKSCASRGSQSDSSQYQQWFSFCGCAYGVASQRWEFTDFSNNFSTYYDQLVEDKTISNCLTKAGLTSN